MQYGAVLSAVVSHPRAVCCRCVMLGSACTTNFSRQPSRPPPPIHPPLASIAAQVKPRRTPFHSLFSWKKPRFPGQSPCIIIPEPSRCQQVSPRTSYKNGPRWWILFFSGKDQSTRPHLPKQSWTNSRHGKAFFPASLAAPIREAPLPARRRKCSRQNPPRCSNASPKVFAMNLSPWRGSLWALFSSCELAPRLGLRQLASIQLTPRIDSSPLQEHSSPIPLRVAIYLKEPMSSAFSISP